MGSRTDWSSGAAAASSCSCSDGITAIKAFLTAVRCFLVFSALNPLGCQATDRLATNYRCTSSMPAHKSFDARFDIIACYTPARLAAPRALYGTCFCANYATESALHYARFYLPDTGYMTISSSRSRSHHSHSRSHSRSYSLARTKPHCTPARCVVGGVNLWPALVSNKNFNAWLWLCWFLI